MSVTRLSSSPESASTPEQLRTLLTAWYGRFGAATFLVIAMLFATAAAAGASPFNGI